MTAATNGSMTDRFASFVESLSYERIPPQVIAKTKEILYDGLGALLSATSPRYDIGAVLRRFVRETGGTPEAQVFGTDLRTNCATAALVNGTFGYYCDIESHHPGAIMHAIAVVGPAALAVGERMHRPGKDVLAAIVCGIDTACRVSYALSGAALYARLPSDLCRGDVRVAGRRGEALRAAGTGAAPRVRPRRHGDVRAPRLGER